MHAHTLQSYRLELSYWWKKKKKGTTAEDEPKIAVDETKWKLFLSFMQWSSGHFTRRRMDATNEYLTEKFSKQSTRHERRTFPLKICRTFAVCAAAGVWVSAPPIICHSERLTEVLGNKKFVCKLKCLINWEQCLLNETHTTFNRHTTRFSRLPLAVARSSQLAAIPLYLKCTRRRCRRRRC